MDLMHAVVTYNADPSLIEDDETAHQVFVQMEDADELVDIICDHKECLGKMFVSAAQLDLVGYNVKHIYEFSYEDGFYGMVALAEDYEEIEPYDIPCGWDVVGTPKWWLIDSIGDVNGYLKSDYSLKEAIEAEKEANR